MSLFSAKRMARQNFLSENDDFFYKKGHSFIAGIDEAGCGSIAGPVVTAVVVLPRYFYCLGLDDSKKMSPALRLQVFDFICRNALAFAISSVSARIVDRINIHSARLLCMRKAVSLLKHPYDCLLVDGPFLPKFDGDIFAKAIPKGDSLHLSIAAASVLAKVSRDRLMEGYGRLYKGYGLEDHKGYGTLYHRTSLEQKGPSPIHRRSYEPLKSWLKV